MPDSPFLSLANPYGGGLMGDLLDTPELRRQRAFDALGGLGAALIQASAPSIVPTNFGDVLGRGLAGANQAMMAGEDRYLKRALTGSQVAMAQQKIKQLSDWQKLFSGDGQATPDPANSGTPAGAAPDLSQPNPNNIGNVRPTGASTGFQQPPDFNTGVQLAVNNAKAYPGQFNNGQPMTLLQIGAKWAPVGDGKNDPVQWAKNVSAISGLPVDQPLNLGDPQVQAAFARGVHGAEWGANAARPVADYQAALTAAPQGTSTPVQYAPQQPKTLAQVVQSMPPGIRQMVGVMGPDKGLPLLMKYADPETTPAIDSATGKVVFAPKTELNSGRFQPVDAQRLQLEQRREAREAANSNVGIDPVTGQPVVNQTAVAARKAISAAQGTDPEGEMLKGDYTDARKANTELQSGALVARTAIAQTNRLAQLLDQVKTGRFTTTTQDIKQMAKGLGVNLEALGVRDDTAPAQAAQALTGQLALALRNPSQGAGMPGSLSDSDRRFLTQMVPGLETTPEGRKLMIDYSLKMYQRQIDLAKIANDFMRSPEAKKDPNALYQKLQDYADKNPLFSEKDLPAGGMTPMPSPPAGYSILGPGGARPAPPAGFRIVK